MTCNKVCNIKDSWDRRSRRQGAICTIPKTDLESVYLKSKTPSDGIVYDEYGINDATLVQSNCGKFDGATYAVGGTDAITNTSNFTLSFLFNYDDKTTVRQGLSNIYSAGQRQFMGLLYNPTPLSSSVLFYFSDDGVATESISLVTTAVNVGDLCYLIVTFDNGYVDITLNNLTQDTILTNNITLTFNSIFSPSTSVLAVACESSIGLNPLNGRMYKIVIGTAEFNIAEGGLSNTLYNSGISGGNATLFGATLDDFWSETQDVYHYNIMNGFDLWEHDTNGIIRVPIGVSVTQSGYSFVSTNPDGKWHNDSETFIQLPDTLSAIQDATPISSITDNKYLEWEDGKVRNTSYQLEVFDTPTGLRFFSLAGVPQVIFNATVKAGITYNYYIESIATTSSLYLQLSDAIFNGVANGVFTGQLTPTLDGIIKLQRNIAPIDLLISKFYIWEEGTVPPLSYREMETNFNDANRTFCNMKENEHKYLIAYSNEKTDTKDLLKIQKCLKVKDSEYVLTNDDDVVLTNDDGIILVAE